jgi:hypothetical protein
MVSTPPARWRRFAVGIASALAITTFGATQQASATTAQTATYRYADANWTTQASSGLVRSSTVRLAPGVERVGGATTRVLEGSIAVKICLGTTLVTVDGVLEGAPTGTVSVQSKQGRASLNARSNLRGTIAFQGAGRNCASPKGTPFVVPYTTGVDVAANWRNAPGSTAVEYTGADCGGDGNCYYRDATATGSISLSRLAIPVSLGTSSSGFLFQGDYPISAS